MSNTKAVLLLEDGSYYQGKSLGKIGTSTGEICFNTGMTGYQEVYTDPSYFGQIMVSTNAHIGNYGVLTKETESEQIQIAGLVCKNFNVKHSRIQGDNTLQDYFENNNLVGISGVDTREIVKKIRSKGAMNCIISSEELDIDNLKSQLKNVPNMDGLELASKVSTPEMYSFGKEDAPITIAALDYGIKKNILRSFADRGCRVHVFPAKSTFSDIQSVNPDGIFLSNGPGDPASMDYAIQCTKDALESRIPLFGICLGHQLLGLALGIDSYKMHHGHRGINHPVKNIITGKLEITSQNHGFGLKAEALRAKEDQIEITHINLNDGTIEGIKVKDRPAMSVQYHPESSPGPHDSRYLFDEFLNLVKNNK